MTFAPPSFFTINELWVITLIMACIIGIETGIICGLATRAGSLRRLFRLRSDMADKSSHKTNKGEDNTTVYPENQGKSKT